VATVIYDIARGLGVLFSVVIVPPVIARADEIAQEIVGWTAES
jgi:hypothetical protein